MKDILTNLLLSLVNVTTITVSYYIHPNVKDVKMASEVLRINDNTLWLLHCNDSLDDISFSVDDISHILLDAKQLIIVFEEDVLEKERIL